MIVGATGASDGSSAGRGYVVFGKQDTDPVALADLGAAGFILSGVASGDLTGRSVGGSGDSNGDGFADLLIGAPSDDPSEAGRSYVVFGVPTADNCCHAHEGVGCTDHTIDACVCAVNAACCDAAWGPQCVELAMTDCNACAG